MLSVVIYRNIWPPKNILLKHAEVLKAVMWLDKTQETGTEKREQQAHGETGRHAHDNM